MNLQQLQAYIAYRRKAKHRKGHGVHSPFMYELVRSVFWAKKTTDEPRNKQERIVERLSVFCHKYGLLLIQVQNTNDLNFYKENCIVILARPRTNMELWHSLVENENTRVTADCWKLGLALAVPHLQKQNYTLII